MLFQLEPRGPSFGLGAPIGISVGFLNSSRRGSTGVVALCDILCDVFVAIGLDKTASGVVGCVHEVNQQQGGSNEH